MDKETGRLFTSAVINCASRPDVRMYAARLFLLLFFDPIPFPGHYWPRNGQCPACSLSFPSSGLIGHSQQERFVGNVCMNCGFRPWLEANGFY
jgi:hypothetical protein